MKDLQTCCKLVSVFAGVIWLLARVCSIFDDRRGCVNIPLEHNLHQRSKTHIQEQNPNKEEST